MRHTSIALLALGITCFCCGRGRGADELPADWQQLSAAKLAEVIELDLRPQDRATVAARIYDTLLADQAAVAALDGKTLFRLAKSVAANLDEAKRQALSQKLAQLYLNNAQTLAAVAPEEAFTLRLAVGRLGGSATSVYVKWMGTGDAWQQANIDQLADMVLLAGGSQEGRPLLGRLLAQAIQKHLSSAAAMAEAKNRWGLFHMARLCSTSLEALAKQQLAANLSKIYVDDATTLAKLSVADLQELKAALGSLGGQDRAVYTKWVSASEAWKSANVDQLCELVATVSFDPSPEGRRALALLLQASQPLLGDAAALGAAGNKWALFRTVRLGGPALDAAGKQQLADNLGKLYVGDAAALAKLSAGELQELKGALEALGSAGRSMYSKWVSAGDAWKNADIDQLCGMVVAVSFDPSPQGRQALSGLLMQAGAKLISQPQLLGAAKNKWALFRTAWLSGRTLGRLQKRQLIEQLNRAYVQDAAALGKLNVGEILELRWAFWNLEEPGGYAANAVAGWVKASSQWQECKPADLAELMRTVGLLDTAAAKELLGQMAAWAWQKYAASADYLSKAEAAELIALSSASAAGLSAPQKQALVQSLRQRFVDAPGALADVPMPTLVLLRQALERLGAGEPERARLAVNWAASNGRYQPSVHCGYETVQTVDYWAFGSSVHGMSSQKDLLLSVREKLTDGQGRVKLGAAALAAYAALEFKAAADYGKDLEQRASQASGDQKALWLLARAYLSEAASDPPAPLGGKGWVDQALAAAESEPMRLLCLQWLVSRYEAINAFEQAQSLLASIEGQFAAEDSKQAIGKLKEGIAAAAANSASSLAALQKRVELERIKGQIASLQGLLEQSRQRGLPAAELALIQQSIDRLTQQLNEASQ